jgi:hypothetical protein
MLVSGGNDAVGQVESEQMFDLMDKVTAFVAAAWGYISGSTQQAWFDSELKRRQAARAAAEESSLALALAALAAAKPAAEAAAALAAAKPKAARKPRRTKALALAAKPAAEAAAALAAAKPASQPAAAIH